jgi:hypothetical protein
MYQLRWYLQEQECTLNTLKKDEVNNIVQLCAHNVGDKVGHDDHRTPSPCQKVHDLKRQHNPGHVGCIMLDYY